MSAEEVQEEVAQPQAGVGQRYINGAISGLIEVTLTHWIDVIKTRLQAEKEITKGITVNSLSQRIWAEEGFKGFYKGYISRMAGIGPMRATFWGTMDVNLPHSALFLLTKFVPCELEAGIELEFIPMNSLLKDEKRLNNEARLITAGAVGGFVQSICDVPIEVAKTKLMTSSNMPLSSVLSEAMKFRGAGATFTRNVIFAMVMNFGINYERSPSAGTGEVMLRAGVSGIVAAAVTQPLDYVKTQQQKVGGLHETNFIKLLMSTGRKSMPLLWTGLISRATLSIATMSVSGTVFRLLAKIEQ